MKVTYAPLHSPAVEQSLAAEGDVAAPTMGDPSAISATAVYEEHVDFLWRSLQHLGVREADLEDAIQEVLVVVHRKHHTYNFECRVTTWLFGICLRVASRQRRRAYFRRERPAEEMPEQVDVNSPEARLIEVRAKAELQRLLDRLSPEHRAAFVMFEIEGLSCQEIANLFAVPVGTIYSRLSNARKQVDCALSREREKIGKGRLR